jgi:hypothetical protein
MVKAPATSASLILRATANGYQRMAVVQFEKLHQFPNTQAIRNLPRCGRHLWPKTMKTHTLPCCGYCFSNKVARVFILAHQLLRFGS